MCPRCAANFRMDEHAALLTSTEQHGKRMRPVTFEGICAEMLRFGDRHALTNVN
jgi:hypothetical protein